MGIAFQSLKNEDTENISYIIPTPVIEHVSCKLSGSLTGSQSAALLALLLHISTSISSAVHQ